MLFRDVMTCSNVVATVGSRVEKAKAIAHLLERVTSREELIVAVHFLIGKLRQGRIGLGPSILRAATPPTSSSEPSLTVLEIDEAFENIKTITGAGSSRARVRVLNQIYTRATASEQRFLTRLVFGELQQGAVEGMMLEAVARAASAPLQIVRRAVMATGDLAGAAATAIMDGSSELSSFVVELFRPVQPMLAQPASDPAEALSRDKPLVAELKLDGARIQVHKLDEDVRVFSRRLREVTHAVPEVVELVRAYPARSLVLDGEVLALRDNNRPYPFQTTMRRFGRKLDVGQLRAELPLTPFFFDVLFHDGAALIDVPLSERTRLLDHQVGQSTIRRQIVRDVEAANRFLAEAIAAGHEGMMLKSLDSVYEAGARGADWFKIKPSHTLDLVVLAADWGHGRRTGWLSNLHLGALDPDTNSFIMLGKTFKGMTDEMLHWQTERLLSLEIGRDKYTVYVRPELVVEIAFNAVQTSTRYPAGLALRFARVKRYRTDKTAAGVDTVATVRSIHRQVAPHVTTDTTHLDIRDSPR